MSSRTLDEVIAELEALAAELKPKVDEYHAVVALLDAHKATRAARSAPMPRRGRRPSGRTPVLKGGGARAEEAFALVRAHPGITVPELSEQMGIGTTYLYRVLPALERNGRVIKKGKGYVIADEEPAT